MSCNQQHARFGFERFVVAFSTGAVLFCAGPASAIPVCGPGMDPNEVMFLMEAVNGSTGGSFVVQRKDGTCDNGGLIWSWHFEDPDNPLQILDGSEVVASIDLLGAEISNPEVSVVYGVTAGPSTTHFTINSGVAIAPMTNPLGIASAANTVTDSTGNGATLTGLYPGGKSFRAGYNFGLVFAYSESSLSVGPFGSTISTDPDVIAVIFDTVTSISATFDFTLSANDHSGGTGVFHLIPEPGSLSLLAVGLIALLRRRRAR